MQPDITPDDIEAARKSIRSTMVATPVLPLTSDKWRAVLPDCASAALKLELFQQVGSFKARGAYLGIDGLGEGRRAAGVVAASGGNHALAVAWAARKRGVSARIAVPRAADPLRISGCRDMGAEVVLCETIADAFEVMERSAAQEGMAKMHPFEGRHMTLGAATCGAEFADQAADLEVVIVPVGGGGLISGMALALKQRRPDIRVIGVEPFGADSLYRSFQEGAPVAIGRVDTIADSLGSPTALPYSYGIARAFVDEVVRVDDDALRAGMTIYREIMGLRVEPACAASLAGALGPARAMVEGRRVGLIACGSNISPERYDSLNASPSQA